jgi:hypothetical protein
VVVEFRSVEHRTKPIDLQVGEKLVIRVWSWDETRLLQDAARGYEIETVERDGIPPPYYSISTFALPRIRGESIDALVDRLTLHAVHERRFKWYCLVTGPELEAEGFELILNEPPDDHYDIPLGVAGIDFAQVRRLALLFGDEKIRMRT